MEYKRLLILANSIKKRGRCVAGQLLGSGTPGYRQGWFRPISDLGEGELLPQHMQVAGGKPLLPFDVVKVPVLRHAANKAHPEDWFVAEAPWEYERTADATKVGAVVESPSDLWLEDELKPNRCSPEFILSRVTHQSLYVIRPELFRIRFEQQLEPGRPTPKWIRRALFTYNGVQYNFSLTDPVFTARYGQKTPPPGQPPIEFACPSADRCLLCVSLTPPFKGFHYKVVATVF